MIYDARFMGWHMVIDAVSAREAQAIANRNVDSVGGIVGVDRPALSRATPDDIAEYEAMGGCVTSRKETQL